MLAKPSSYLSPIILSQLMNKPMALAMKLFLAGHAPGDRRLIAFGLEGELDLAGPFKRFHEGKSDVDEIVGLAFRDVPAPFTISCCLPI